MTKTFRIAARLDVDTIAVIDGLAAQRRVSRSEVIRMLARDYRNQRTANELCRPDPEAERARAV